MQPNNTPEGLWDRFVSTGRVSDYLRYRNQAATGKEEGYGDDHEHTGSNYTREQQYR